MKNPTATICLSLMLFFGSGGVSYSGLFGPSNYDECIIESMKGVKSDLAAAAVMKACMNKFPSKKSPTFTPSPIKKKTPPELDSNGMKVCRVISENGNWSFVTKERLSKLKNVKQLAVTTSEGEKITWVTPSDYDARMPGQYVISKMQGACRLHYLKQR